MRSRQTILILAAAQFVMVLDTTVMNVSISQVVADLHTTVPKLQLAITAYTLVMAAFMLTGAKLGDMFGRRKIFAIGLAVYGVGSLITALSPNITVLLIGWSGIEGLGAVMVIPAIAALTAANYTGKERALAFGLIGGVAGAGAAAGPLIGGFVSTALTWRVVFAAETIVVIAILTRVRRIGDHPVENPPTLDGVGVALSAIGMGLTVLGILKSSEWGLLQPKGALTINGTEITPLGFSVVPFMIAGGLIVLGGFARWEQHMVRRGRTPLLAPDLLHIPQLRAGASMIVSQYLILAGTFFVLPLFLQLVLEENALHTGLKILPMSVAMMVAALIGARLADRFSPRSIVQAGVALLLPSLIGVMSTISVTLSGAAFGISLAGFGAGIGLVISQLNNVVMSSVGEERSSEAGGVTGTAQNLGQSLGTALIGAVLLAGLTSGFHERIAADPAIPQDVAEQVQKSSESGVAMVSRSQARTIAEDAGLPPAQVDAVVADYESAQIDALKNALLVAALMVLVALWFARALPGQTLGEQDAPARAGPEVAAAAGSPA